MRLKYLTALTLTAFLTVLFIACSPKVNPYGMYKPINSENIYKLRQDSTTRTEVESYFGKPQRTSVTEQGYQYSYSYFGDSLFLQFANNNTLQKFNYDPEIFTPDYENMNLTKRSFPNRVVRRIIPGETKLSQLTSMFGRPNRGEKGKTRYRTTFIGTTQDLIVHSSIPDDLIIDFQLINK